MKVYLVKYTKKAEDGWSGDECELVFERRRDAFKCANLIVRARQIDMLSVKELNV